MVGVCVWVGKLVEGCEGRMSMLVGEEGSQATQKDL